MARARIAKLTEPRIQDSAPSTPTAARRAGTYWEHNGSVLRLEASGSDRKFYYHEPGERIRQQGATPGTLLFEGRRSGNKYSGTAYIFRSGCGKFAYSVSGDVSNGHTAVVVRGRAPTIGSNCKVAGYRADTLRFDYKYKVD